MKLRYIVLIAIFLAVGPVGYAKAVAWLMMAAFDRGYLSSAAAYQCGVSLIAFPFFLWCVWVLTNMEKYERILKRITG